MDEDLVFIDTETTGLDPNQAEILEVAAVKFDRFGTIKEEFYSLCKPISGHIPKEASDINHITIDKVKDCRYYMDIRPELAAFIGKSTLIGHNLKAFDILFLKMQPVQMEDTLEMCRAIWPGKNNLANACKRLSIKFEKEKAHSAMYDVKKGVELYLTLKAMNKTNQTSTMKQEAAPTQVYSYSRIQLFHTCPFKWRQVYILKNKEPEHSYFVIGKAIHKVAQISAEWCYMRTFANKFSIYIKLNNIAIPKDALNLAHEAIKRGAFYLPKTKEELNPIHIGMFLYANQGYVFTFFGKTMIEFVEAINASVKEGEYEVVDRPDETTYLQIVQRAMAVEHCTDPEFVTEVVRLADFFYKQKDYSMRAGEVALVEKQFVFDKNWKPLDDWYSDDAYMRGALDIIEYDADNFITITDYKSGRKMLNEAQLRNDNQMKVYVLFIHKFLPTVQAIKVKHHYIRFGKTVSFVIENIEQAANEAEAWISESINQIEREMLKPEKEAFQPKRNEFCGNCFLAESNTCPLFNVKNINDIEDPAHFVVKTIDDLRRAWKKIEVNKMEISNLTSKCKMFVKECQGRVSIDHEAILDLWVKEDVEYDATKVTKLLLEKKVDINQILNHFSIPKTELEKLIRRAKVEVSEEELKSVSSKKTSTKFDAFTKKEVEDAGFLNA